MGHGELWECEEEEFPVKQGLRQRGEAEDIQYRAAGRGRLRTRGQQLRETRKQSKVNHDQRMRGFAGELWLSLQEPKRRWMGYLLEPPLDRLGAKTWLASPGAKHSTELLSFRLLRSEASLSAMFTGVIVLSLGELCTALFLISSLIF